MSQSVINEYLVALKYGINNSSAQQFNQSLEQARRAVDQAMSGMQMSVVGVTTKMATAYATVTVAIGGMMVALSKADMEYQKFGLHMWVSAQAAKEMKTTLDAMGESLEDISFIPELRGQFQQLLGQGKGMMPPSDYADQMREIRQITFEFKRMKLEASFALEWIGYYIFKYLEGPIRKIKEWLQEFNNNIQAKMPEWTQKIAKFLAQFLQIGMAVADTIRWIYESLSRLWTEMPDGIRRLMVALGALWAVFMLSPIGRFIAAFAVLMLLVEDFWVYLQGGKSAEALKPLWKFFEGLYKESKKDGAFGGIKVQVTELDAALTRLGLAFENVGKAFKTLGGEIKSSDAFDFLNNSLKQLIQGFTFLADLIVAILEGRVSEFLWAKLKKWSEGGILNPGPNPNEKDTGDWGPGSGPGGGGGGGSNAGGGLGKTWRKEGDWVNTQGLKPNALSAIDAIAAWWQRQTGRQLTVSSGYRPGDPGGHGRGQKFDAVDDATTTLLEDNVGGIRDRLIAYAESIGLKVLDEYKYPSAGTTAGHLDFSAAGFKPSGGMAMNTVNNIYVNVPAGSDSQQIAMATVKELERVQGKANITFISQMRDLQGVGA